MTDSTGAGPNNPDGDARSQRSSIAGGGVALAVATGQVDRMLPYLLAADCDAAKRDQLRTFLIKVHVVPVAEIGIEPPHLGNTSQASRLFVRFQNEADFSAEFVGGPPEFISLLANGLAGILRCPVVYGEPWTDGGAHDER